ncbi:MAG: GspH/FimT family pseudopilin [Halioglobus sp.]|nr:GspH/FimT family pseudopilin [Halioglobus sp.]
MMMALVVLAVLLAVAAPGFYELIKNNRMLSEVYALRATLNGARSEALAQRNFVTLCRSADGATCSTGDWNSGFIAFLDENGNGAVDDPNAPLFLSKVKDEDELQVSYRYTVGGSSGNWVQFDSRGYAAKDSQGTFTVCDIRGPSHARGLSISAGGVVSAVELDPNDPNLCN